MREPTIIPGSLVALTSDTSFTQTFTEHFHSGEKVPAEGPVLLNSDIALVVCRPGRNMQALLVWTRDGAPVTGWAYILALRSLQ